ncbi:MAG: hypothetical protein HYU66_06405 [Armatimonadetes bacterium]|nr:hypothetical protein [Armatimonadota bacterium]
MTARWWRIGWLGLAVWAVRPGAAETPILHLSDVKPGMKGYGLTVFQGTKIEKFDVTVLGVLHAFDFAMDMILIRVENGPCVTKGWGILAGMSGSPIYIDGKLMGALAYGWEFQKEAVAGITPIEQMLAQYDPKDPRVQTAELHGSLRPDGGVMQVADQVVHEVRVLPTHAAARQLGAVPRDVGILTPVATPLFVSGLGVGGMKWLDGFLAPYNIVPLQGGAAQVPEDTPAELVPGAAVAVTIGSGDIDLTAIGTVTYVDGDTVLAFGHPFFGFGAVDIPMATASMGRSGPWGTSSRTAPPVSAARSGPAPTPCPSATTSGRRAAAPTAPSTST